MIDIPEGMRLERYHDPSEPETEPLGMCAVLAPGENFWHVPKYWYGNLDKAIADCAERIKK